MRVSPGESAAASTVDPDSEVPQRDVPGRVDADVVALDRQIGVQAREKMPLKLPEITFLASADDPPMTVPSLRADARCRASVRPASTRPVPAAVVPTIVTLDDRPGWGGEVEPIAHDDVVVDHCPRRRSAPRPTHRRRRCRSPMKTWMPTVVAQVGEPSASVPTKLPAITLRSDGNDDPGLEPIDDQAADRAVAAVEGQSDAARAIAAVDLDERGRRRCPSPACWLEPRAGCNRRSSPGR